MRRIPLPAEPAPTGDGAPAAPAPAPPEAPLARDGPVSFEEYLRRTAETGTVHVGSALPIGTDLRHGGANFALFSRHATRVWLELFDGPFDDRPSRRFELTPEHHRTGDIWHVWIADVRPGQLYAYRAEGPYRPAEGHRFNVHRLLLDPYATAVARLDGWDFTRALGYDPAAPGRDLACAAGDNSAFTPKCVFTADDFDWGGDRPPRHPNAEMVIYETHVRGFTIDPSSGVTHPGSYRGIIDKIPYLKALGVTTLELMPVQEFNENELQRSNPLTGEPLRNYWGYNPVSFMAVNGAYASAGSLGQQKLEFKEMVKALHRAGIEVILDVVFNHTAEGNELGPTFSWRGIDNAVYYMLAEDRRFYRDFTGTGNTVNANHAVLRGVLIDALRYWVVEMRVDGFRFDLASVLGRDSSGRLLANPPIIERIAEDPILRDAETIAEAWDAAGAYQVGSFSMHRWAEWNGRYRDDVRRFWRGDEGMIGAFATRLAGSSDLYEKSGKGPEASVNFVTCHDGFTLYDLVSYERKHNEANGEENRDGADENFSCNYGVEGASDDPAVEAVRNRMVKNFLLTLFVSRGIPMLLGGDEFRRTQGGNNNAYCQDNATSWFDWHLLDRHWDVFRFTWEMVAFRKANPVLRRPRFYTDREMRWASPDGDAPGWDDPGRKRLACRIAEEDGPELYLLFNADPEAAEFVLPRLDDGRRWLLKADTFLPSPGDIREAGEEVPLVDQRRYLVEGRTSVILIAPRPNGAGPGATETSTLPP